jgi:FAD:protein FMN transferase
MGEPAEGDTASMRAHPDAPAPMMALPTGMARHTFRAMGTTIELLLPIEHEEQGIAAAQALFAEWEGHLSRFLPESELSLLNQRAGEPVEVGEVLYRVLETALSAANATDGLYDPTLLRQMLWVGYDRTFDELPATLPAVTSRIAPGGGWRGIRLDAERRRVTLPRGVGLDFGGIAKGMAVDAAIDRLGEMGIASAVVNAGGDLAVLGLPAGQEHWPIAVPGKDVSWSIPLCQGALATSGIARRHWRQGTDERHHLLDPRTGEPVHTGLWSVTVAAGRCQQAEVAAKAAFILGAERGAEWLGAQGLAGLLVGEDGSWRAAGAWPVELMRVVE